MIQSALALTFHSYLTSPQKFLYFARYPRLSHICFQHLLYCLTVEIFRILNCTPVDGGSVLHVAFDLRRLCERHLVRE